MKQILYDMGPMKLVFKGLSHPSDQDPSWRGSPHQKIEEKKSLLGKSNVLSPIFFSFFLVENSTNLFFLTLPYPLSLNLVLIMQS